MTRNGARSDQKRSHSYTVGVLHKAIDVLDVVVSSAVPLSVSEVAQRAEISTSSAYRILGTLETRQYIRRDGRSGDVSVGPALLALSRATLASSPFLINVQRAMQRLHDSCRETVNFAILSGTSIRYLEMIESPRGLRTTVNVGTTDHLHSTSLGRAILAALPVEEAGELLRTTRRAKVTEKTRVTLKDLIAVLDETRERGYSIDDEENEMGALCIGVAVRGDDRRPIGAISISGPVSRVRSEVARLGSRLRDVVTELERTMGVSNG